jgi:hypothetical protein
MSGAMLLLTHTPLVGAENKFILILFQNQESFLDRDKFFRHFCYLYSDSGVLYVKLNVIVLSSTWMCIYLFMNFIYVSKNKQLSMTFLSNGTQTQAEHIVRHSAMLLAVSQMYSGNRWVDYPNTSNRIIKKETWRWLTEPMCATAGFKLLQCMLLHGALYFGGGGVKKALCISYFGTKYILYVNSHIAPFASFVRD